MQIRGERKKGENEAGLGGKEEGERGGEWVRRKDGRVPFILSGLRGLSLAEEGI